MAHLLLIEAPGGNDFDLFESALMQGHQVTFFTADGAHYAQNGTLSEYLTFAKRIVEINPFDYDEFEKQAVEIHEQDPFDALLCLIDIRITEAARLAERLNLRFLNPKTAVAMRDKFTVRTLLAEKGIRQPEFALATNNQQLRAAIENMGFPVLVKPSDGYGSQNIAAFLTEDDLNPLLDPLDNYLPCRTDYGFGVKANDRLLVERYISGQLVGCDTLTQNGKHIMLGINEKLMYPQPSSAIKGSCFPSDRYEISKIEDYVFSILDALEFNDGVTHTEILLSEEGPFLVEVNPRLVGAKIPRLLNLALGRSIHADVIDLHLGKPLSKLAYRAGYGYAVSRWIITDITGSLEEVIIPPISSPGIRHIEVLKKPGDPVSYPYQNSDRIGYVMTLGDTREQAERLADDYIAQVQVKVSPL
ncbi:ATP-grasp domain-containing protein [Methylobacter sp.]|uniref:ATP-grasp domain-containing protein n=1 Tax=Methylobacter sp. TaxID=2051955 RepID=UPI002FDE78D8